MSFFVIEVRTGKELQAKEMIKHLLKKSSNEEMKLVKSVHALQNYTTYVDENSDNPLKTNQDDTYNQVVADSIVELLGNLKKQYQELKHRTDAESEIEKMAIKEEMGKLEKELHGLRKESPKTKVLLPGYIIIELQPGSDYLPSSLWNLIMKCPLVRSIPSRFRVPEEEIFWLFNSEDTELQVELQFEMVMSDEEIELREKELLHSANTATNIQEEVKYLEESKKLKNNLVSEINELKKSTNSSLNRIKAFIRNKRETVSMPVSLFFELYIEFKETHYLPFLSSTDFLNRLKQLIAFNDSLRGST